MIRAPRGRAVFALLALVVSAAWVYGLVAQPGYTDAYYHFNAAVRLARGDGLTDPYLWTYIAAPPQLPAPSHLYWMPMTSLLAGAGMWLLGAPGVYAAAQWPLVLLLWAAAVLGYALGWRLGGSPRHAWLAGLLVLFGGYFVRFWGATDTFAPYAFFGAACLWALGRLGEGGRHHARWALLGGVLAGCAHLTRADGLLLLLVGWAVLLWPWGSRAPVRGRVTGAALLALGYLLVMLPWFARNLALVGSPLPVGGAQAIWFTSYDELFSYPADAGAAALGDNLGLLLAARWEAFTNNLGTFVAVEGWIVLTPLMLLGLWRRRREPFLRGFWLYALGLHLAMTLVFPFPGYRGGLFHSAAALLPWWAALAVVGLDDAVAWAVRYRRRWRVAEARRVFSLALVVLALALSLSIALPGRLALGTPPLYTALAAALPDDARVMINDPAQLYYFTGLGGVPLPNESPETILDIARQYEVGYLVLEGRTATPLPLWPLYDETPAFLQPLALDVGSVRVYAITLPPE